MKIFTPLFSLLSPGGARGRLSTFIFHRVLPERDDIFPGETDALRFRQVLGWISTWFNVLPLDEAAARLASGSLPARAAVITFDDGYADNYTVAMPLLQAFCLPATFFVASGFLDGGRMWNDNIIEAIRRSPLPEIDLQRLGRGHHVLDSIAARRRTIIQLIDSIKYLEITERLDLVAAIAEISQAVLPDALMMTSEQVRKLAAAGMQIGAHTMQHPILARLPEARVRAEIGGSKERLEYLCGRRITLFAYPNGKPGMDFRPADVAIVKDMGFDAAVTTAPGVANSRTDLLQIPRFTPWDQQEWRFGAKLLANYFHAENKS